MDFKQLSKEASIRMRACAISVLVLCASCKDRTLDNITEGKLRSIHISGLIADSPYILDHATLIGGGYTEISKEFSASFRKFTASNELEHLHAFNKGGALCDAYQKPLTILLQRRDEKTWLFRFVSNGRNGVYNSGDIDDIVVEQIYEVRTDQP